jgi:RNA ligase (TIGR02306 family)
MSFPHFLRKTDETRVQVCQGLLNMHLGKPCYIMEKLDGSSHTSFSISKKGRKFGVCSRNLELIEDDVNNFWKVAKHFNLEEKLKSYGKNVALQGEMIGPSIQGNKYKLDEITLRFFSVYDIDSNRYLSYPEVKKVLSDLDLPSVPILEENVILHNDIQKWVEYSKGKSVLNKDVHREGIVVRLMEDSHQSFKVINPDFLLKYDL